MAASRSTRKQVEHGVFGHPSDLPPSQLPTLGDVLRQVWKYKCEEEEVTQRKFVQKNDALNQALSDVSDLWEKAIGNRKEVPLISVKAGIGRLKRIYEKGIDLNKKKIKNDSPKVKEEILKFKDNMLKLFDICSCSCSSISCQLVRCKLKQCDGFHLDCRCDIKVPKREIMFLIDQRTDRKMKIDGIDKPVTEMWARSEALEADIASRSAQLEEKKLEEATNHKKAQEAFAALDENQNVDMDEIASGVEDGDYEPPAGLVENVLQNRTKLTKTAEACDRYMVSDRAGAAIASAVLTDYGIIHEDDKSQVIGPRKLASERHRCRMAAIKEANDGREAMTSVYFDGKKTSTRVLVKNAKTGRWSPRQVIQDHYVIIVEPGAEYLTHVTPPSGHGKVIAATIFQYLVDENLLDEPLYVAGADGTNSNVGAKNGAIHFLEMMLGRPLHYCICQLHGNELPFRALFYYYDGKPDGPEHWSGPVGKSIKNKVASLPVVAFQAVQSADFPDLPEAIIADLSWDQKYLYRICMALIAGVVEDDLAAIEPGPPCVSRWNTLWSRICRVYAGTAKPTLKLRRIVNMIVKFSAPMWFHIKCHPSVTKGPLNTFKSLQLLRNLNAGEKAIAKKAVQRNSFFAHPDQLLLAMCADQDEVVRQKAVGLIRKFRKDGKDDNIQDDTDSDDDDAIEVDEDLLRYTDDDCSEDDEAEVEEIVLDSSIREVHVPQLKWRAKSYHTMIDWNKELVSEPPFIAKLTDDEIVNILDTPLVVPKWSNNTQSVERGIKLVSEACTAVTGKVERDGYIRQRIHSRKLMPQFNTKRDFNHNL